MCFDFRIIGLVILLAASSCSSVRRMERIKEGQVQVSLSIADEIDENQMDDKDVVIDSIKGSLSDEPLLMNAIRDTETGDMVATDVIRASKVVARFRNVPERDGYVTVAFDVTVPSEMASSKWQLKIFPILQIQNDSMDLEPLFVTGRQYRGRQLRGYERYHAFISSILTDEEDFLKIGQLEIFLRRHFPETYAMKTDSTVITDPVAENLFGVTQMDAFEHYRRSLKWKHNERRRSLAVKKYRKYVKDPILLEGIRLDTVLTDAGGDFVYRYLQTFRSRPGLRKVNVSLRGQIYEDGECFLSLPFPDDLTFYISSLSSLADDIVKYKMIIRHRTISDNTKAFIDFPQSSSVVDTLWGDNASELKRIIECIDDVVAMDEYVLDSLVIVASCSPEGPYRLNERLSAERSAAVKEYIGNYVPKEWKDSLKTAVLPENWSQLMRLVENDTLLSVEAKRQIAIWGADVDEDPDAVETKISGMPEYVYLREKLYPKLRTVGFDFYLHRVDMVQDTIWTTELDTVYMKGLQAVKELDYKRAVTLLRPYDDYNTALAFVCADYNHSALDVLGRLDKDDPRVCYMKALVLSRLEQYDEALKYFELALAYDPTMEFRANLDPEMCELVKLRCNGHETE